LTEKLNVDLRDLLNNLERERLNDRQVKTLQSLSIILTGRGCILDKWRLNRTSQQFLERGLNRRQVWNKQNFSSILIGSG
jgi:hypothetical protein